MKFGSWAPRNCFKIEAIGNAKAELSQSHDFLEILKVLDLQIGPQNH